MRYAYIRTFSKTLKPVLCVVLSSAELSVALNFLNSKRIEATRHTNDVVKQDISNYCHKNMSISQWKLLNQLKDYLSKTQSERGSLFVLNKDWIKFLQKFSSVYVQSGEPESHNVSATTFTQRASMLDKPELQAVKEQPVKAEVSTKLTTVLNDFKTKINQKPAVVIPEDTISKWKSKSDFVSEPSIRSRTKHVVSLIENAESVLSRLKRIGDLTNHLNQFPGAKHLAVKEGAISLLLRIRQQTEDTETLAVIRESLTLLGYADPLPNQGIRILSIDGGGIRGVIVLEMLKRLEDLTGKKVYEMFDYICGVSTGAILACVVGAQRKSLDEVSDLYKEMSTKIFTQNPIVGTSSLVWSHAYYSTEMWEQLLRKYVGETILIKTSRDPQCPKIAAVSAVVNKEQVMAFIFRNYTLSYKIQSQYFGSHQYALWEAARASAAAPSYFEECKLGDLLHQDGGILVNNPCAVAIHEAKRLWPGSPIQCIISMGTGRCQPVINVEEITNNNNTSSSWKTKFLKILDSATDTEAVHTMLSDLLPRSKYYRFNPYLTEMVSMDEFRPEKLAQLEMDAEMYFRRNRETFQEAATALVQKKTVKQQFQDWASLQMELYRQKH